MSKLSVRALSSLALVRSSVYLLEQIPINLMSRYLGGPGVVRPNEAQLQLIWNRMRALYDRDARAIAGGVYPLSALDFETPWAHARSFTGVLKDGLRVAWRMHTKNHADFTPAVRANAAELPEYYVRNFHFQTDGYLSEASARRYDHQVDILFGGAAGAMRRMILPVLKRFTPANGRILDLGAGTGSSTRPVLATFPKARVTALDLSSPYLKVAQDRLRKFPRVDFVQGDATALPFKDASFDAAYSVYVLHELPAKEREALVKEALRVLKPGGVLILADSLQIDDEPDLNWALEQFPKVHHEPFYTNYSRDRLEDLLERMSGRPAESEHALFTKVAWIQKPDTDAPAADGAD